MQAQSNSLFAPERAQGLTRSWSRWIDERVSKRTMPSGAFLSRARPVPDPSEVDSTNRESCKGVTDDLGLNAASTE